MEQIEREQLPEVSIYAIGPEEVEYAASLLTSEAASLIRNAEAVGLALVEEGEICAAVCAGLSPRNETVLEIISLYVAKKFRRRGLGTTLVLELLERMMEATDASLQFLTASYLSNNDALSALFSELGFEIIQEESAISWQLPIGKLMDSTLMKTAATLPDNTTLRSLESLSGYDIRQLVQKLEEYQIDMLSAEQIEQAHGEASYVLMDENDEPAVCAIFTVSENCHITLSQFFTVYKNPTPSIEVLQASAKILLEQFPSDAVLEIPTLTGSSGKLVQRLLPDSQAVYLNRAVLDLTKI